MASCALPIDEKWNIVETESEKHNGKGYRFFPHLLNGEGFFLACFKKRKSGEKPNKIDPNRSRKNKTDLTSLQSFVDTENKVGLLQNDHLMLIEAAHAEYAEYFAQHLKLVKKGILCGKVISTR